MDTFAIVGAEPRRREGGRGAARGGLRRADRADRRRAGAALRAPAPVQGLPARRLSAPAGVRPRGVLLRRPRNRAQDERGGERARRELARGRARGRRASSVRPPAARDRRRATSPLRSRRRARRRPRSARAGRLQRARRALPQGREAGRRRRRLDRGRGRHLGARAGRRGDHGHSRLAAARASARSRGGGGLPRHPTDHGVEFLPHTAVAGFEGDGAVARVRTEDGRAIDCDFAVVGAGVVPSIELAEEAGLDVDDGIAVDERLETSAPGIFAAGDVANARHALYGRRIRVEHWANALRQGPAAARNMLGREQPYERLPYFFSDQYDVGMEYSGYA